MSEILLSQGQGQGQGRRCGYCSRFGHNQGNCRRANADGLTIHSQINSSVQRAIERNRNLKEWLSMILHNYTVRQLTILMRAIFLEGPQATTFISTLEAYRIVPVGTSLLRLKHDRVSVLIYFYSSIQLPNNNPKLAIETKDFIVKEDCNHFNCPICIESHESTEKLITNCNHEVCKTCMVNFLEHHIKNHPEKNPTCSLCRTTISSIAFGNKDYKEEIKKKYFI
jgi:hypothetical protein